MIQPGEKRLGNFEQLNGKSRNIVLQLEAQNNRLRSTRQV
jgi:hypothetical protein